MHTKIVILALACLLSATAAMAQPPATSSAGSVKPAAPDATLGMALMGAVVDVNGNLVSGAGAIGSSHLGTGAYEIDFVRDVTKCMYVASVGVPDSNNTNGVAATALRNGSNTAVFVETLPTDGSLLADRPFHLIVFCGQ